MKLGYCEKIFINPGIEYGIRNYLSWKKKNEYERIHTFEMHVIKALTIIYGEKSILLPYQIDNEKAFECNLLMYDLKESDMHKFINYMNEYYEFMKKIKSEKRATGLITEIEKILIQMIFKRNKRREFSNEELKEFDKIFNPINGDLKQIKNLLSTDKGLITKAWQDSKYELTNTQIKMIAVNPHLLSQEQYQKFGFDIRTIATLSENEIITVNKKIMKEENWVNQPMRKKRVSRKPVLLTTGSGFVDTLMLLSMIATGTMVGIIISTVLGG